MRSHGLTPSATQRNPGRMAGVCLKRTTTTTSKRRTNKNVRQNKPCGERPRVLNGSTWTYIPSYAGFYVNHSQVPAQCFSLNDNYNYYVLNHEPTDPNDYAWVVNSTQNGRNPDYTGTGSGGTVPGGGTGGGGCLRLCPQIRTKS